MCFFGRFFGCNSLITNTLVGNTNFFSVSLELYTVLRCNSNTIFGKTATV